MVVSFNFNEYDTWLMTLYILYKRRGTCECHASWEAKNAWIEGDTNELGSQYLLNYIDPQTNKILSESFDSEYDAQEYIYSEGIKSYKLYSNIKTGKDIPEDEDVLEDVHIWCEKKNRYEHYFELQARELKNYKVGDTIYIYGRRRTIYKTRAEAEAEAVKSPIFELVIEGHRP